MSPTIRRSRARLAQKIQQRTIGIRLFADERETLENAAKQANKSLSDYVREKLFTPVKEISPAIPPPNCGQFEPLEKENRNGEAGEFFSTIKNGPSDAVSKKTGHRLACDCFACGRLRALLKK